MTIENTGEGICGACMVLIGVHPETRIFVRDQGMRKILPQAYS